MEVVSLFLAQIEAQSAIIGGIVGLSVILARVIEKLVDNRKPNGEDKLYLKMDALLARLVEKEEQLLRPIYDTVIWIKDVHSQKDARGRFVWHGYEAVDLLQEILKAEQAKVEQFKTLLSITESNNSKLSAMAQKIGGVIQELENLKRAIIKNGQNHK